MLPQGRWFFGTLVPPLLHLLAFWTKSPCLAPTPRFSIIGLLYGRWHQRGLGNTSIYNMLDITMAQFLGLFCCTKLYWDLPSVIEVKIGSSAPPSGIKDFPASAGVLLRSGVTNMLTCSVNCCCTAKWPSHTYIYILLLTSSFIVFHHKWMDLVPWATGSHCLSTPNAIVCIYEPQTPSPSHSLPLPLGNHKSVLQVHEFVSLLQIGSFVPFRASFLHKLRKYGTKSLIRWPRIKSRCYATLPMTLGRHELVHNLGSYELVSSSLIRR